MVDIPYFMENEIWYRFDAIKKRYVLSDDAPKKARESFEEWAQEVESENS